MRNNDILTQFGIPISHFIVIRCWICKIFRIFSAKKPYA